MVIVSHWSVHFEFPVFSIGENEIIGGRPGCTALYMFRVQQFSRNEGGMLKL